MKIREPRVLGFICQIPMKASMLTSSTAFGSFIKDGFHNDRAILSQAIAS